MCKNADVASIAIKIRRRHPGTDGKTLDDHRQDGHVAVGGIGNNLERYGPSAVSEIQRNKNKKNFEQKCLYFFHQVR